MTSTIWKFELEVIDVQRVPMPQGARLLSVQGQPIERWGENTAASYTALMLWAQVDTEAPIVDRLIAVVGTGDPAPDVGDENAVYVGSALCAPYVWHIFDGGES